MDPTAVRAPRPGANATENARTQRTLRQRGQVLAIFAAATILFVGILAIVIDVSWYWANSLRVQRASDAAALAGVVWLPGNSATAQSAANNEAAKNGYVTGVGGVTITAQQDSQVISGGNPNQLDVSVTAPVKTFFMRLFGINTITTYRTSKAIFVLPVPMGSPNASFGYPTAHDNQGNNLNIWGAIMGPNAAKQNGDPFATRVDNVNDSTQTNAQYVTPSTNSAGAYNYGVEFAASSAATSIWLWDPALCDRGSLTTDDGDYYYGDTNGGNAIDTSYTLYQPDSTPYIYSDDVAVSGGSATYSTASNCTAAYKNAWVKLVTLASPMAGVYRLNVSTKGSGATPTKGDVTNQFAIWACAGSASAPAGNPPSCGSGTQPQVYGLGSMSIFANIANGTTYIYLAQIPAVDAGKTMEVSLFDPGDCSGSCNASMQFQMPTSGGYSAQAFTYYDAGVDGTLSPAPSSSSGSPPALVTTTNGTIKYQGHWVVVDIPIPAGYTAPQGGWWKVAYNYNTQTTDRTTWEVDIKGNPVHLVVP